MPKYLSPQIIQFINSRLGRDRCLWGTNGLPWKESLKQLCELGLREDVQRKIMRENAIELFRLNETNSRVDDSVNAIPEIETAVRPYLSAN